MRAVRRGTRIVRIDSASGIGRESWVVRMVR
jgi:hypothetical protein